MQLMKRLSVLSLLVVAPCVVSSQTPATPASNPPPPMQHEQMQAREARRMEVRKMVMARAAMADYGGMRGGAMPMMDAASMLLGHTGELQLTDAQVTKLAAIARRAEGREKTMRTRMDSVMTRTRGEAMTDGMADEMRMVSFRMAAPSDADRRAMHEDNREAFSIVTADQLATAWELMAMHHRGR